MHVQALNTMAVAGGGMHSLVLTTEGLFSFGRKDSGQLGCTAAINKDDWGAFETSPMEVRKVVVAAVDVVFDGCWR